jgi:hypothetical protein
MNPQEPLYVGRPARQNPTGPYGLLSFFAAPYYGRPSIWRRQSDEARRPSVLAFRQPRSIRNYDTFLAFIPYASSLGGRHGQPG